jgi:protein CpxP
MEDSSKRRFLRRATLATLVGGLAAGSGAAVWAHDGARRWHPGAFTADPARMGVWIEHRVKHFAVDLDATPEQTAKLVEIAKAAAADLQPLREKIREARRHGMALLTAPAVDRAAIERLRSEQIQAVDAASRRLSQALADAAEVLTPEQRKKAAGHLRAWGGRGARGRRG